MTLIVMTFTRDFETAAVTCWPSTPGEALAGFEAWRVQVWGSLAVLQRHATFLPRLNQQDLYVENAELAEFRNECETLLREAPAIASEIGYVGERDLAFRIENILRAITRAEEMHGGVYIG